MTYQKDDSAIRNLIQQLSDYWAAGNAQSYRQLFTENADYVGFDGVNQKGRATIIAGHRLLFEKWLKGSRIVGQIVSIRFLAPDVALIHATGNTILAGKETPSPDSESISKLWHI